MRILVLALNYAPEPVGAAVYTAGLCEALVAMGHTVEVVAAKPYYPSWRVLPEYRGGWRKERRNGVSLVRCPLYVPRQPSGLRRILHHLSFAMSALMPMLRRARRNRPDVVLTVAPSLIAAPVAKAAALVAGARCWLHVQDLEVSAAFATGLVDARGLAARVAREGERRIMNSFDRVSSISPEMCATLTTIVPADRVVEFRNWSDLDPGAVRSGAAYRTDWGLGDRFVALYSGNIANKQGIDILIDAARLLAHREDIAFVVCGDGPNRDRFAEAAAGLANILIHPLQPKERLGELLAAADVHLLPQVGGAADLVLPSKLTNMLASARPVIATAAPGTGLAREVLGCGIVVPPDDPAAFAGAILDLADAGDRRAAYGDAARTRAIERWDRESILAGFAGDLAALAGPDR